MLPFTQTERPLSLTTPLGKQALLLVGLEGRETLSGLYSFQLDLLSEEPSIAFDKILGQKATVELTLPNADKRYFSGIIKRISQAERGMTFTRYSAELVPQVWLLTRKAQSRTFQHISVPDILKKVFQGLDVSYEIVGSFHPRDFCVQYRETDFAFASRIMEEEGIYYFFKQSADGHKMVVANTPQSHPDLPEAKVIYEEVSGHLYKEDRIHGWEKTQELSSGKYTLWDHCFELPNKHLEADKSILESVQVGRTTHKLKVGGNDSLEIYDYPGGYAQRFDGVDKGGGDSSSNIQEIFTDNKRTVEIRMQAETVPGLVIHGASTCRQFVPGYKFTLERHFSDDGKYVLTAVEHSCRQEIGTSATGEFEYRNRFTCIPFALPYRPPRITPLPRVHGTQTAVVVGPAGEEIFTDKYGRVKVQFHWDREGQNDANSSCWVRVGTVWAGKQWGVIHIPRIGQEVIVDFLEGDPDQPIIVGSVYNVDQMPPYSLPDNKTQSGVKSRSSLHGGADNFNEIRFEDKKGQEQIVVHAEKDLLTTVEHDETREVQHDRITTITNDETKTITDGNEVITIKKGNQTFEISLGKQTNTINGDQSTTIKQGNQSTELKMGNMSTKMDLGKGETEAMQSLEYKVGQSSIKIDQTGVTIKGMMIKIEGQIQVQVKGLMTQVNGDAMLQLKGGVTMIN